MSDFPLSTLLLYNSNNRTRSKRIERSDKRTLKLSSAGRCGELPHLDNREEVHHRFFHNTRKQKYPRGLVARADIAIELEQQFLVNVRRNQTKMRKRIHRLHRGSKVRAELDWRLRLAHGQRSITGVSY